MTYLILLFELTFSQVPISPSSLQYYTAHRDKQGRFYCEYCATPNTIKVKIRRILYMLCINNIISIIYTIYIKILFSMS